MPKNEDGEFELILGNKQLLSVFFIVVILLGVFFAMGFIVGRNSPAPVTEAVARKGDKPIVVDSTARQPEPIVVQTPPKETAPQEPAAEPPKQPEPDAAKAEQQAKEEARLRAEADKRAKASEEKERARVKKELKAETRDKAKKVDRATPSVGTPSGTYLQLAATTQHEAEAMVDLLRRKEFRSIASEVPERPGLYRVLVGPISDSSVAKSRSDLLAAGFPGDKAIKRTY